MTCVYETGNLEELVTAMAEISLYAKRTMAVVADVLIEISGVALTATNNATRQKKYTDLDRIYIDEVDGKEIAKKYTGVKESEVDSFVLVN